MSRTLKLRLALFLFDVFDLIAFLFFVVGIVLTVRFFVFNPFTVVGQSMQPTFEQGDFIIVDKITPKYWEIVRDDIIVFVPEWKDVPFIKRVIGMPWETVVVKHGEIYTCESQNLDSLEVDEIDTTQCMKADTSFLKEWMSTLASCRKEVFPLQSDWYFAVGDNRSHSTDSRCCFWSSCYEWANYQVFPRDIIGKVAVKLYPDITKY